jgi:type I restriction enzyme S subunit
MITAVDCTIVRFNAKYVLPQFFNFYSQSLDYLKSVRAETTGTTRDRISRSSLGQIVLPVPPLQQQRRIVGILDDALDAVESAKTNAERNLQNVRALFESRLQSVFTQRSSGWVEKRLDEVCEIIMGQSPDGETYNATGEGTPLINGPVEFSPDSFGKTVRSKFTTQPTKLCKKDDLILCVRGSTTGRMNIAGFDACVGRGVAAIRAREYQPWINHFINAKRGEIYRLGTGATFPNVSGSMLGALKLSVPVLAVQREIATKLDSLREETQRLESIYQQKLAALEALKSSLLHQAFTGSL